MRRSPSFRPANGCPHSYGMLPPTGFGGSIFCDNTRLSLQTIRLSHDGSRWLLKAQSLFLISMLLCFYVCNHLANIMFLNFDKDKVKSGLLQIYTDFLRRQAAIFFTCPLPKGTCAGIPLPGHSARQAKHGATRRIRAPIRGGWHG